MPFSIDHTSIYAIKRAIDHVIKPFDQVFKFAVKFAKPPQKAEQCEVVRAGVDTRRKRTGSKGAFDICLNTATAINVNTAAAVVVTDKPRMYNDRKNAPPLRIVHKATQLKFWEVNSFCAHKRKVADLNFFHFYASTLLKSVLTKIFLSIKFSK